MMAEIPPLPTLPEIIRLAEEKGFFGMIDRLNRSVITPDRAWGELHGVIFKDPVFDPLNPPRSMERLDPWIVAEQWKRAGMDRQESWSRWLQRTELRPGMDAKDWYRIFDSV